MSSSEQPTQRKATSLDGQKVSEFVGFRFPNNKDKIPEDYIADPKTGLRPGEKVKPSGVGKTFLNKGFSEWTTIPPAEQWNRGVWFVLLNQEQQLALENIVGTDTWEAWVVHGEGSPGNFLMRVYIVPDEIAAMVEPTHPLAWPEKLKRTSTYQPVYTGYGYGYSGGSSGWASGGRTTAPSTPKTQAPALPAGIRFRCADCGHWFKQDGLAAHKTNCCPGKEESRESDWALLCECCLTLDEVSACKPGFPRPKPVKEVKPKEQTEVKKDETPATAEVVQ